MVPAQDAARGARSGRRPWRPFATTLRGRRSLVVFAAIGGLLLLAAGVVVVNKLREEQRREEAYRAESARRRDELLATRARPGATTPGSDPSAAAPAPAPAPEGSALDRLNEAVARRALGARAVTGGLDADPEFHRSLEVTDPASQRRYTVTRLDLALGWAQSLHALADVCALRTRGDVLGARDRAALERLVARESCAGVASVERGLRGLGLTVLSRSNARENGGARSFTITYARGAGCGAEMTFRDLRAARGAAARSGGSRVLLVAPADPTDNAGARALLAVLLGE